MGKKIFFDKRSRYWVRYFLILLFLASIYLASYVDIIRAQNDSTFIQHDHNEEVNPVGEIPTITIEQDGITTEYPDWSQITFSRLGNIEEGGEIEARDKRLDYNFSRSWSAGDSPSQFLKLGDFQDKFGDLTLNDISQRSLTEINVNTIPLSSFNLVGLQTLAELIEAIPELENLRVDRVPPIRDLVGKTNGNRLIGSLKYGSLGRRSLNEVDLSLYTVDSIPGLAETSLSEFAGWKNSYLNEIPGLWDLPLNEVIESEFSTDEDGATTTINGVNVTVTPGIIGIVDIAYGTAESHRQNTITGSYQEGFEVDCEEDCAYAELGNWSYGKQWISGKYQNVRGGFGVLGMVNGGREPTGRHPFGNLFKVVVWDTNESEGLVDTALFLRSCQRFPIDLGCTPYFIGPVPFLSYHEKDTMFVGVINPLAVEYSSSTVSVVPETNIPVPPSNNEGLVNPLPGATVTSEFGYRNTGIPGATRFHSGIDLAYPLGDARYPGQIIAAGDGVVTYAGRDNSGCGTLIWIEHGGELKTGYCHQSQIYVNRNDTVRQGQIIAQVGNEGVSSNPHLHFIVYENGKKVNPRQHVNF